MIAKVIVHGKTRQAALDALYDALTKTHVAGTPTNKQFLTALARHKGFAAGSFDTGLIERDLESLIRPQPPGPAHLAFAAIAALGLRPDRPHFGFRLWGAAQHEANLSAGGETFALRLNLGDGGRATMECGGEETTLADIETGPGTISARFGATEARVVASVNVAQSAAGRAVSVMIDGVTHELSMGDSRNGQRLSGSDQSDAVLAPMTGQVVSVLVAAGDTVAQGTKLGIMEAMKMETTLTAPRDATIATVLCATGDAVEGGAPLFLFEPESPS